MLEALCRCCRIPVEGVRARVRVCPLCDACDGKHGPELYQHVRALVSSGRIPLGLALTRLAIDDAHYTGKLEYRGDPSCASLWVREAPKRFEVVIAHCIARGEAPDLETVVGACLAPFMGENATREVVQAIADDLTTALCFIDPNVIDVDVKAERDVLDPHHLVIQVNTRTAVMPGAITMPGGEHVEVPGYVMRAKPAEA